LKVALLAEWKTTTTRTTKSTKDTKKGPRGVCPEGAYHIELLIDKRLIVDQKSKVARRKEETIRFLLQALRALRVLRGYRWMNANTFVHVTGHPLPLPTGTSL
jgi:hypothetical protein